MSESIKKKDITYISALKTICMLCVTIGHCMYFYTTNPFVPVRAEVSSDIAVYFCGFLDVTVIAGFIFASGFLMSERAKRRKIAILPDIWNRTKRLLVPYYLFGLFWLVPTYTIFDFVCFGRESGTGFLEGVKLMALGVFSDHMWFLWLLIWISIFWTIVGGLLKGKMPIVGLLLGIAFALVDRFLLGDFPYFKISQVADYTMVFFVGAFASDIRGKLESIKKSYMLIFSAVCLGFAIAYIIINPGWFVFWWIIKIFGGLMGFTFFMGIRDTSAFVKINDSKVWNYLKENSMLIYLFNNPYPYLYFRLLYPYIGKNPVPCMLANIVLSYASILLTVEIYRRIRSLIIGIIRSGRKEQ